MKQLYSQILLSLCTITSISGCVSSSSSINAFNEKTSNKTNFRPNYNIINAEAPYPEHVKDSLLENIKIEDGEGNTIESSKINTLEDLNGKTIIRKARDTANTTDAAQAAQIIQAITAATGAAGANSQDTSSLTGNTKADTENSERMSVTVKNGYILLKHINGATEFKYLQDFSGYGYNIGDTEPKVFTTEHIDSDSKHHTLYDNLPTGTAQYIGHAVEFDSSKQEPIIGTTRLNVNFDNKTIEGKITIANRTIELEQTNITKATNIAKYDGAVRESSNRGTYSGFFFGEDGEDATETAGTVNIPNYRGVAFGGKRQ